MTVRPPSIEAGEAQEKKGDWAKAAQVYEQCAAATPDERVLLKLAAVREKLGQPPEAAAAYRKVAELQRKAGFAAKAVAALRQAARLLPDDVPLAAELAAELEAQGKLGDAVQVLEGAGRAAALRGDDAGRLELLERLAVLDGSLPLALSLADALARAGRRAEAIDRLQKAALRLGQEGAHADRLAVLERVLLLSPGDREAALQASKLALLVRQPRRGLVAVRNALDEHLEDAELVSAAARALDAMGERIRGTLLHREAARRLERAGDASAAYDEWRTVLTFDPADQESLEHMRALSAPASATPAPVPQPEPPPPPQGREQTLEIQLDEVSPARVEIDIPVVPATATPVPVLLPEPLFVLPEELPAQAEPTAAPALLPTPAVGGPFGSVPVSGPPKSPPRAFVPPAAASPATVELSKGASKRALVLGDGPEAAWIERALSDLDLCVERMGRDAMTVALEKAEQLHPELVFSPPALAQAWRESGPWKVASLVALSRAHARSAVQAEGLDVVASDKVESAEALKAAIAKFGAPLELVGPFEGPLTVPGTGSPSYHLTVARERLGPELLAQAAQASRTQVLVAGDGRDATALAAWQETSESGLTLFESPGPQDEGPALVFAKRVARALNLEGLAVVVLSSRGGRDAFESMRLCWGPGGLAVEERLGFSLPELAANLARGEPVLQEVERRGVALAALAKGELASVANLRVEPSAEGAEAFVCSRAADRAQALRRLLRALKR